MERDYGSIYRDLYTRHWWWRAREATILQLLDACLPADGRQRILDVGCGDGLLFPQLVPYGRVEGVEADGDLVSPGTGWRRSIHIGDFNEAFLPHGRYTVILMLDVLEHFADPLAALRKAHGLLEDGGMLLLHVPAFRALWTMHDELNHHYTRFSRAGLRQLLHAAAFRVDRLEYTFQWLFPAKLAVRAKEKLCGTRPSLPQVPGPTINRLCYWISRGERWLLRQLRPPFGSSLVAVASPVLREHVSAAGPGSAAEDVDPQPVELIDTCRTAAGSPTSP
jgi:SAM-dependent methyltransferase